MALPLENKSQFGTVDAPAPDGVTDEIDWSPLDHADNPLAKQ
jgi:hypothetical protein